MIYIFVASAAVYIISIAILSYAMIKSRSLVDKVLAADVILYTSAGVLGIASFLIRSKAVATSILVFVLWAYALDVYIARYLEDRGIGRG